MPSRVSGIFLHGLFIYRVFEIFSNPFAVDEDAFCAIKLSLIVPLNALNDFLLVRDIIEIQFDTMSRNITMEISFVSIMNNRESIGLQ